MSYFFCRRQNTFAPHDQQLPKRLLQPHGNLQRKVIRDQLVFYQQRMIYRSTQTIREARTRKTTSTQRSSKKNSCYRTRRGPLTPRNLCKESRVFRMMISPGNTETCVSSRSIRCPFPDRRAGRPDASEKRRYTPASLYI